MKYKTSSGPVPDTFARTVAEGINLQVYKENLQATAELISQIYMILGKERLRSSKDYIEAYNTGFNTYKSWSDVIESLGKDRSSMAEDECYLALNKTIFKLPCGLYIWATKRF